MNNHEILHPAHYTTGWIEVWDFIKDQKLGYFRGNVVKYLCRAGRKTPTLDGEIEDLEKAAAYLQKELEHLRAKKRQEEAEAVEQKLRTEKELAALRRKLMGLPDEADEEIRQETGEDQA